MDRSTGSPFRGGVRRLIAIAAAFAGAAAVASIAACSASDHVAPHHIQLRSITVDSGPFVIERGATKQLTVTVRDTRDSVVAVPVVWQSSNDSIATVDAWGHLIGRDTGIVAIRATSLGVASPAVGVRVVWFGAANIAQYQWTAPNAVTPSSTVADSARVLVTNLAGNPVPGVRVAFAVDSGGGSVTPAVATTGPTGVAATVWVTGPAIGPNRITATVVDSLGHAVPWIAHNPAAFRVTTYNALRVVRGDSQTTQILSKVATQPAVLLVDSTGKPRPGVPVTFTAYQNGQVTTPTVSTDANGVASPGDWTLGDFTGDQILVARVESATLTLHATGTGTPILFQASRIAAAGYATCAIATSGTTECWGQQPIVGDSTTVNRTVPTPVHGSIAFDTVTASATHACGLTSTGALYCWGTNALVDTTGTTVSTVVPTQLSSSIAWSVVSPGYAHNCALAIGGTAYCWGDNSYGQLGDGTDTTRFAPKAVTGGFQFSAIASGGGHSCALSTTGAALCWGLNQYGQLGDGTTTSRSSPTSVGGGLTFQSLGTGYNFSCGLTTAGKLYCWGAWGGALPQTTPQQLASTMSFVKLTVGAAHACALTATGAAYCWGDDSYGQLGDSTTTTRHDPVAVGGGFQYSTISAGYAHTCAVISTGGVACWGLNRAGELGNSSLGDRTTPIRIVLGVTP